MTNQRTLSILNLLAFMGVILVNTLANALPINGKSTGAVSAEFENFFTPIGFTFAIWSLIYLSLLLFVGYQFFPAARKSGVVKDIRFIFIINCMANMAWIYAWHYQFFELTLLLMLILLWSLVRINLTIVTHSWWAKFPFQVYLGWICVATIANIAVYFKYIGVSVSTDTEILVAFVMMIIAGALAILLTVKKTWIAASLALAWGIFGLYRKQVLYFPEGSYYQWGCLLMVVMIIVVVVMNMLKRRNLLVK